MDETFPKSLLSRFRLDWVMGRSRSGVVWAVTELRSMRPLVLKRLPLTLLAEGWPRHPNLLSIVEQPRWDLLVMERVRGLPLRLFVYNCYDRDGHWHKGYVINPVLETSEIPKTMPQPDGSDDEGCLSVPGEFFPTGRAEWARITGVDLNGDPVEDEGYGFFARCLQHETGHLDGYVYTDVLTGRYKRQAKRAIKRNGWGEPGNTWLPGSDADSFGHDDED